MKRIYNYGSTLLQGTIFFILGHSAHAAVFTAGTSPSYVAEADVNGDGKSDLIVANYGSNDVSVLLGDGAGGFGAATNYAVGTTPYSVAVGDMNGDGKLDLAVANFNSNNVSVLLNDGAGGFLAATNYVVGTNPISVAIANVSELHDGNVDLIVANWGSNDVNVLVGNGAGGFGALLTYAVGTQPWSVTVNDVNGDGHLDLVAANYGSSNVSVLLGNGYAGFGAATNYLAGSGPTSVSVSDFNGDGKLDLATANYGSNDVSVLLGNGSGGFGAATNFATAGTNPLRLAVGDVNGDGNLDLATANYGSDDVSVLLGDGSGGFGTAATHAVGTTPYSVALGDVSGDSKLDLATANWGSNDVTVSLGDGSGSFDPDLLMTNVTPNSASVNAGASLSVTDTVENQNPESSDAFAINYRLSANSTFGDSDDVVIGTNRSLSGLGGGASNTATTSLIIPATATPGTYYLCAKADLANKVSESNEDNNTLCSTGTITVGALPALPDLVVSKVSTGATTAKAGASILVTNTVRNQGGSSTGSRSVEAFHFSLDTTYGNSDDVVSTSTQLISPLSSQASVVNVTSVVLPSTMPAGAYYVCAKADDDVTATYSVAESDETNNVTCTDTSITVPIPDLKATSFTNYYTSVHPGGTIKVVDQVQNVGGSAALNFTMGYVLSPNNVIGDSDDIVLPGTRFLASLNSGATSKVATTLTVPTSVPLGVYYVGVIDDVGDAVSESDEGNNTLKATTLLTVKP